MDKEYLLQETIVQLTADIYQHVYETKETWTESSQEIIHLAKQFEKELNWQEDDERDFILELEKFEEKYLKTIKKKPINDCYQELKHREISELKDAVTKTGGKVLFDLDDAPLVLVNFDGYAPHSADVRISCVSLKDDRLLIDGQEKEASGCSEWFEDDSPIEIDDIAYSHISFITDYITAGTYLPSWDASTGCLSDGSWCEIDSGDETWEYQSDCDDDNTYMSGSYITDEHDDGLVVDYDGCEELPKGVKAALIANGYRLDL